MKFNIGIEAVASYIPSTAVDNLEQGSQFDVDEGFVLDKIGCRTLPRLSDDETVTSACQAAFEALSARTGIDPRSIECIVVCTQTPDHGGIPHSSALVQAAIDAPEQCAGFDIGLGCSGYVYGLQVVASFMQMHGMKKGLLFTCDPYSRILDPEDKNTSLLFGDGATVTLLSDTPKFVSQACKFSTRGESALIKVDGKLVMNGRAVFNFALMDVPKQIQELLESEEVDKSEIDLFLLHQGSRFMLENTIKRIGDIQDRAPVNLEFTGNLVSSSIPVLLEKYLDEPALQTLVFSGFGVGLSWASAIYSRVTR
ncbi:ketoacyl-ACP synthase III [Pseudomonas sp. CAN2814]|uniref:ketoacyl-ACP synthase III n=1 Tax=Pseudomonas sp. CAN1 TaxID=3046726 RepID=UPI002649C1D8|nr:ketoacyl-ACP synthase III [Pseudomonas sp. CAN1]MDN6856456.1 ketoacyl-ACP synthase III [Pseudomonas sp. CAN1]